MKYIYQLFIILVVTFIGELLHYFIPIPVPASIYGLIIMLILLCTKVVKLEHVERTSDFLIEIMPLMFIPAGVGLMNSWDVMESVLIPLTVITAASTIFCHGCDGKDGSAHLSEKTNGKDRNNNMESIAGTSLYFWDAAQCGSLSVRDMAEEKNGAFYLKSPSGGDYCRYFIFKGISCEL